MTPTRACLYFALVLAFTACGDKADQRTNKSNGESADNGEKVELVAIEGIRRPEGFIVEKLHDIPLAPFGSLISLTFDSKGDLLAGSEKGPLNRIRLNDEGKVEGMEMVQGAPGQVHGILEAFNSLYLVSNEKEGLVRCRDVNDDGIYDQTELLLPLQGEGEHGPHAIILSADGENLILIAGNHCPSTRATFSSLPAPGGWIGLLPPDASNIEIIASGLRNAYDVVLNSQGDLFTCDSDAEQDAGLPWYRPPRFLHAVNGADFGWRKGPEKWPKHYADSLPPIAELGPSSPAGLVSGHLTHFPKPYRNAIFVLDSTFGTIYSIHLKPEGAGYNAKSQIFLSGLNMPLTDAAIHPDGSLYFVTGGRGAPSKLYRVRHENPTEPSQESQPSPRLREQRLRLESFHKGNPSDRALREAWENLGNPDRWVRHAARVALERQPVDGWRTLFEKETNNRASIHASLALARKAPVHRRAALAKLSNLNFKTLNDENQLAYLRTLAIALKVKSAPPSELLARITPQLDAAYPSASDAINMELSRILSQLEPKGFINKTLNLLQSRRSSRTNVDFAILNPNPAYGDRFRRFAENPADPLGLHLAFMASHADAGNWRPAQMQRLASWLRESLKHAPPGTNYHDVINRLSDNVENALTPAVRAKLGALLLSPSTPRILPQGPGRNWTLTAALKATEALSRRNFANGRRTYEAASCADCHVFAGKGKAFGPVLDGLSQRYSRGTLLEAIIHPSRALPETCVSSIITTKSGNVFSGRIVSRDKEGLFIAENPFAPNDIARLEQSVIEQEETSPVSPMPTALLNSLNPDELKDLTAYLLADGKAADSRFSRSN
jgi:putative heme-binding domain-containing protein